jgi:hypothetical protein
MSLNNSRLETPTGAPSSLTFDLPSSMINSTKTEIRIQPYGQSTYNQSGQVIKFVIPRTDRAFMNTQTMYITGNYDLTGALSGTAAGTDFYYILGTYYSMFSRQTVTSNGKTLETIEKPGELVNMILNQTLNPAERKAMANTFGFYNDVSGGEGDATYNICQIMNTGNAGILTLGNNGKSFSFSLPIIGLLNCGKMIPLINGDFQIELTLNDLKNYIATNTVLGAVPLVAGTIGFQITNLELVVDQVTLTPESFAVVLAAYPGKLHIKSQSYDFASGASFQISPGAIDIPINIKRTSLKQILYYFTQSDLVDKGFGAINCNLIDCVFLTNGYQYPIRPIKINNNPSEVMSQNLKSYGSMYSNNHSGSCGKLEFCRRTTGSNNYYVALTVPAVGTAADTDYAKILLASNKFYMSIDMEIVNYDSSSLYSGVAMGTNSNFRINIGDAATTKQATPYAWFCYDAIIEFDLINNINNVIA